MIEIRNPPLTCVTALAAEMLRVEWSARNMGCLKPDPSASTPHSNRFGVRRVVLPNEAVYHNAIHVLCLGTRVLKPPPKDALFRHRYSLPRHQVIPRPDLLHQSLTLLILPSRPMKPPVTATANHDSKQNMHLALSPPAGEPVVHVASCPRNPPANQTRCQYPHKSYKLPRAAHASRITHTHTHTHTYMFVRTRAWRTKDVGCRCGAAEIKWICQYSTLHLITDGHMQMHYTLSTLSQIALRHILKIYYSQATQPGQMFG